MIKFKTSAEKTEVSISCLKFTLKIFKINDMEFFSGPTRSREIWHRIVRCFILILKNAGPTCRIFPRIRSR